MLFSFSYFYFIVLYSSNKEGIVNRLALIICCGLMVDGFPFSLLTAYKSYYM